MLHGCRTCGPDSWQFQEARAPVSVLYKPMWQQRSPLPLHPPWTLPQSPPVLTPLSKPLPSQNTDRGFPPTPQHTAHRKLLHRTFWRVHSYRRTFYTWWKTTWDSRFKNFVEDRGRPPGPPSSCLCPPTEFLNPGGPLACSLQELMSLRVLFPSPSHAAPTTHTEHASNHNNLYSRHSAPTGSAFLIIKESIEHPRLRHLCLAYYTGDSGPRLLLEALHT